MKPVRTVMRRLEPILKKEGFNRENGTPSFRKETPEGTYYVEIYAAPYFEGFEIRLNFWGSIVKPEYKDLEKHTWQHFEVKGQNLERFEGLNQYDYRDGLESAVDLAESHLLKYGLRWLRGEDVETEYLRQEKERTLKDKFNRLTRDARKLFKASNYSECIQTYEDAEKIGKLDKVDLKFLQMAKKYLT